MDSWQARSPLSLGDISAESLLHQDPRALLRQGVEVRNAGGYDLAELLLTAARLKLPKSWQVHYELGLLQQRVGRSEEALGSLARAFELNPKSTAVVRNLVAAYAVHGLHDEAESVLQCCVPQHFDMLKAVRELEQFAKFVQKFPAADVCSWHTSITEARGGLLTAEGLAGVICERLRTSSPFAFVRLGDGEGAWLHRDVEDERRYGELLERNRLEFWDIWFGQERRSARAEFYHETWKILDELDQADVIGIPPWSWIQHEYSIGSLRGCTGTVNAVRVAERFAGESAKFCTQLMHFELERNGHLGDIISKADKVGVISCHPGFADLVKKRFNVSDVMFFSVPGEPSRAELLGEDSVRGEHFPARFREILAALEGQDFSGVLFLVAGGILGKLYALRLQGAGAVALDVGSVADKLMDKKTRPFF